MKHQIKVDVSSEIRIIQSTQSQRHVEFLNGKPGGTQRNRWALKG